VTISERIEAGGRERRVLAWVSSASWRLEQAAALQQVAELCGRLPLALQITAEILKADPGQPVAAMAAELQDPPARLDAERPTLIAAVTLAAATGRADTAVFLVLRLAVFLDWRRHFDDMITTGQAAA